MSEQVERDGRESPRADAVEVPATVVKVQAPVRGRGNHPNSKKNLRVGPPTLHGEPSRKQLLQMLRDQKSPSEDTSKPQTLEAHKPQTPKEEKNAGHESKLPFVVRDTLESAPKQLPNVPDRVSDNGTVDDEFDEKTVQAVLATLSKLKRMKDVVTYSEEKKPSNKRRRTYVTSSDSSDAEEEVARPKSRKQKNNSPVAHTSYAPTRPLPNHPGGLSFWRTPLRRL
jgi:hypothetical protein